MPEYLEYGRIQGIWDMRPQPHREVESFRYYYYYYYYYGRTLSDASMLYFADVFLIFFLFPP